MRNGNKELIITVDKYTRICLTVIAALLTVLIVGLWSQSAPLAPNAQAAELFVDAGAQRNALIKGQELTNARLEELIALLKSGDVKVQLTGQAGKDGANAAASKPK